MKQFLPILIGLGLLCNAQFTTAQTYTLTDKQKAEFEEIKHLSKLGLGFHKLLNDPSAIDQFIVKDGRVSFIATMKAAPLTRTSSSNLMSQLSDSGMKNCTSEKNVVRGTVAIEDIKNFEEMEDIQFVVPEYKPVLEVGLVDNEADRSMLTDSIKIDLGLDGTGIKIGILSDSYNALGGADSSVVNGDLPGLGNPNGYTKPVVVLKDIPAGSDEGRGMAELIHDVAPGAELYFYTAFDGILDFAAGIRALDSAGCDIIVDDVSYFVESYFQDGAVGGAVNDVVANGKVYFSSAGNSDRASYEDAYKPSGFTGPLTGGELHDFSDGDVAQTLVVPAGATIWLWIQWDDPQPAFNDKPNPAPQTDMAALLFDATEGTFLVGSDFDNIGGGYNIELIEYENTTDADQVVDLLIEKVSGPDPRRLKYIDREESAIFLDTKGSNAGTCVGHSNVEGAIGTGASAFFNTPEFNDFREEIGAPRIDTARINGFSSAGGTPLLLASDGTPIEPLLTFNPFITGPDGSNTSFFGFDIGLDPDTNPNFFGTSAAAPHVAAAVSLLLQADKSLSPADIKEILKATAEDMDDPLTPEVDAGYDVKTGYGFVNAQDAISYVLDGCEESSIGLLSIDKAKYIKGVKSAEVGIYRAVQTLGLRKNIIIQRKVEVNIDSIDTGDQDGWTTIAQTNGYGQDGLLLGMSVEDGIPAVYVKAIGRRKATKLIPESLSPVTSTSLRPMEVVGTNLVFKGCESIGDGDGSVVADVSIYPNPTTDVVTIEGNIEEDMNIFIYNSSYRKIYKGAFSAGESATISLGAFGTGKYYAIISFANGKLFKKQIIVE